MLKVKQFRGCGFWGFGVLFRTLRFSRGLGLAESGFYGIWAPLPGRTPQPQSLKSHPGPGPAWTWS